MAEPIYTISLHQPWASFIAVGAKPFETRDWAPPKWLIGKRIAIHAAKKPVNADDREWARRHGCNDIPFGAVVCTAVLAGAYQCGAHFKAPPRTIVTIIDGLPGSRGGISIVLDEFGDYAERRWAWLLTDIEPLSPAIPARGMQGFWKWERPE